MHTLKVLFKRDFINIALNPMLFLYNTVFSFLMIVVLGFLNRGNYGNTGLDSYDFYGITMLIYAALNASTTAANSFMEKSIKTTNLRVIYSPIRLSDIYLSKILATFAFTSVCLIGVVTASSLLLGVNYGGAYIPGVILLLLLFNLFSSALGVFMCCIFKSEELSNKILSLVNTLLSVLGGLFFQMDGLGNGVRFISRMSPVKWVSEGIFKMIYDQESGFYLPTCIILAALTLLLVFGCKKTFKTEDYV